MSSNTPPPTLETLEQNLKELQARRAAIRAGYATELLSHLVDSDDEVTEDAGKEPPNTRNTWTQPDSL